jgi:excisionase family DNA binding protein
MSMRASPPDSLTPDEAATYLGVDRATIDHYVRQGTLAASRHDGEYLVSRGDLDTLIERSGSRDAIRLRDYTPEEIERFVAEDTLSGRTKEIAERIRQIVDRRLRS